MNERIVRWLAPAAVVTAAIVWLGAAELPGPARFAVVVFLGLLPPLLLVQAAVPEQEARALRVMPVYLSSLVLICGIGAFAWWAGRASGFSPAELGLVPIGLAAALLWTGGVVLVALAVLALGRALRWRESPLLERLLPRSAGERVVFVLLALAAGSCEELAFRGFLIPALRVASGSTAMALVLSSLAFGMLHSYQSATGALRASALGALMAVPLLATGSLLPSMAAHSIYDLIAGLLLADWTLRRPRE